MMPNGSTSTEKSDDALRVMELSTAITRLCTAMNQVLNRVARSEEHTSELQSLMRISYAVFCLKKTKLSHNKVNTHVCTHITHVHHIRHSSHATSYQKPNIQL